MKSTISFASQEVSEWACPRAGEPDQSLIVTGTTHQECIMADDKTNPGEQDRARVSGSEPYEVEYFASRHGLSQQQARELISSVGNNRAKLDAAAVGIKGEGGQG